MAIRCGPVADCHRGPVTTTTTPAPGAAPDATSDATSRADRPRAVRLPRTVRVPHLRLPRPRLSRGGSASAIGLGIAAGTWAAGIGLALVAIPMIVVWMTSANDDLTWAQSVRIAATIWSLAHTTPVVVGTVTYSLLPWGLALIGVTLVATGARWAMRRLPAGAGVGALVAATAVSYAGWAAGIAVAAGPSGIDVPVGRAVTHALVVALAGVAVAVARDGRIDVERVPSTARIAVRAGLAAAAVLVGLGAFGAAAVLVVRFDDAVRLLAQADGGVGGGLVLVVLGIGYAPTLAMWSTAYLLGSGVVLGPAVTASPFVATTAATQLPPFPLLAAVPATAGPLAWGLPVAGVLAGVVAGVLVARAGRGQARLVRVAMAAGAAGVAGAVLAGLALLSSGSLGDLRLAHLGPSPGAVGLLAALLVGLGAIPVAGLRAVVGRTGLRVAAVDAGDPPSDTLAADRSPADAGS